MRWLKELRLARLRLSGGKTNDARQESLGVEILLETIQVMGLPEFGQSIGLPMAGRVINRSRPMF